MRPPDSTALRALLHLLASAAGGVLIGLPAGLVGGALGRGNPNGFADLIGSILLGALGYMIGAGLASSLAAKWLGRPARWALALAVSVLSGIAVLILAEPLHLNASPDLLRGVFLVAVPLAATFVPRLLPGRHEDK